MSKLKLKLNQGPAIKEPEDVPQSNQRYVALRNVDKRKAEGWKIVEEVKDKHGKRFGVRVHADDLVLMEKG